MPAIFSSRMSLSLRSRSHKRGIVALAHPQSSSSYSALTARPGGRTSRGGPPAPAVPRRKIISAGQGPSRPQSTSSTRAACTDLDLEVETIRYMMSRQCSVLSSFDEDVFNPSGSTTEEEDHWGHFVDTEGEERTTYY